MVHEHALADPIIETIKPYQANVFLGTGYPSFSKVVNDCIMAASEEYIIICSYKVRPTSNDIRKLFAHLNQGYAFVELYRFACFGFSKELIRHIGFLDERYVNGGYEDCDFTLRLLESQIPFVETESIEYIFQASTWSYANAREFHTKKWNSNEILTTQKIYRLLDDEIYPYDLGPKTTETLRNPNIESIFLPGSIPASRCTFYKHGPA